MTKTKTKTNQQDQLKQLTGKELTTVVGGAKQAGRRARTTNAQYNVYAKGGHYGGSSVNSKW